MKNNKWNYMRGEESKTKDKKKKETGRGKKGKIAGIVCGLCLAAAATAYVVYGLRYQNTFLPGVSINQIKATGLTVEAVEKQIADKVEKYNLSLTFREDKQESIEGAAFAYRYVSDGSVEKLMKKQNWLLWGLGYFKKQSHTVGEGISYDERLLGELLEQLPELAEENQVDPEDAKLVYENNEFVIHKEVQGSKLKTEEFKQSVFEAVKQSLPSVNAEELQAYETPSVLDSDETLNANKEFLNANSKASITYTLMDGSSRVLDGNTIMGWMSLGEDGKYFKDEAVFNGALTDYVTQLASEYNTKKNGLTFTDVSGHLRTVKGGNYLWIIDKEGEIQQLSEDIAQGNVVSRNPVYASEGSATGNGGIGNTYIECDLGNQKVYYIKDGKIVWQSDCVSGRMTSGDRRTPEGVYSIYAMQKNRVLRGEPKEDGTYSYESPVSFWMPFYRGYGLHDATWRSKFGGSIYKYSGSHGCVNLPLNKAKELFAQISVGTILVSYY